MLLPSHKGGSGHETRRGTRRGKGSLRKWEGKKDCNGMTWSFSGDGVDGRKSGGRATKQTV